MKNLQSYLLALEIQKSDLSIEAITKLINARIEKLKDQTFDTDDIKKLLIEIQEPSHPERFVNGLTKYIDDCTCSGEYKIDLDTFKIYVEEFKNDQE